jgi:hypothetical protein
MRKQFYEKVLPSQGIYCAAGIDRSGKTFHRFVDTLDELEIEIENFQADGLNAFVAMNSFSGHSRKAEYAAYCKSFFIDLDVEVGNPKKYASKEDALAALDDFIKIAELPPPVRVDSGGGIHAYWILDRDVPTAEWKAYATKFKQLCLDHIKIDPAVTADAARVLRCPETLHLKGDPKPTLFLDTEFNEYEFDMFKQYLGEVDLDTQSLLAILPKGMDDDTREIAKLNNFQTTFQEIAERSLEGNGCNQISNILINASTLEEPLWYAGLSIARHCTDWETAIHLMSEDHPEYNRETTIRKSEQAFGKPFACDKFESLNPGGCGGCPFRGRITNPLAIGRRLAEAPTVEEIHPEDAIRIEKDSQAIPVFPAFLKPYVRGVNGGVYYVPPTKVDEDGKKIQDDPICLSVNDLAPIKRMYSAADGETLMMRHLMKHDPTKEFLLPMKLVYASDKLKEILSSNSVTFLPNHLLHIQNYLIKWDQYLQSKDRAEIMHMQMGWTENNDGFVVGLTEITRSGEERKASASPLVRNISKLLNPAGDYEIWKKSANALNEPGFEMHAFGVLCGFGSPLMRYTSTSGVMVSFTSVESGNAKTGAMYGGISVWGDPKELSVVDGNATDNAFIGRLLNLKNLMFGIDEASNARPEDISRLVHRISQGKAKMRMQASVNAERDLEMTASLIAMLTSNQPMYDKLQTIKASPDGEVARLVEFVIERPQPMAANPHMGKEIFDPFRHNYGFAGIEFIKYVFKVGDDVIKQKMNAWQARFESDFGTDTSFRFYQNLILATFTAGELAVEAGILEYDLPRIYKKVVNKMIDIRDNTVKIAPSDFKTLLGEFGDMNQSKFLFMDGEKLINQYDPRELLGRIEIDTGMYYVSRTEFKKFLAERGVSTRQFEAVMKEDKVLMGVEKKRLGAGWKGGASFHPIWVYAFKTNNVEELINAKKN